MKTAYRNLPVRLALGAVSVALFFYGLHDAQGQGQPPLPSPPSPSFVTTTSSSGLESPDLPVVPSSAKLPPQPDSTPPSSATTSPLPPVSPSGVAVNSVALPSLSPPGSRDEDIRTPGSVDSIVKKLDGATRGITLEDMNAAREALAKLDLLIDIEKRLNDLSEVRNGRKGKNLADAIPASALGFKSTASPPVFPPSSPHPSFPLQPATPLPHLSMPPGNADIRVERIVGASGQYAAYVKIGDSKPSLVREGDKVPEGTVVAITNRAVTFVKDQKKRTVSLRGVGTVFGAH